MKEQQNDNSVCLKVKYKFPQRTKEICNKNMIKRRDMLRNLIVRKVQ